MRNLCRVTKFVVICYGSSGQFIHAMLGRIRSLDLGTGGKHSLIKDTCHGNNTDVAYRVLHLSLVMDMLCSGVEIA